MIVLRSKLKSVRSLGFNILGMRIIVPPPFDFLLVTVNLSHEKRQNDSLCRSSFLFACSLFKIGGISYTTTNSGLNLCTIVSISSSCFIDNSFSV